MHGARGGAPEGKHNGNFKHGARTKQATADAHIGVLRAAEPDVEGVFDTSRKTPHWGTRKLKSDE
jgi:hypothetical protein